MQKKSDSDLPRSAAKRRAQRAPLPAKSKRPSAKKLTREQQPAVYLPIEKGEVPMGDMELLLVAKTMGWLPAIKEAARQGRAKGSSMRDAAARLGVSMQLLEAWNRTPAAAKEALEL